LANGEFTWSLGLRFDSWRWAYQPGTVEPAHRASDRPSLSLATADGEGSSLPDNRMAETVLRGGFTAAGRVGQERLTWSVVAFCGSRLSQNIHAISCRLCRSASCDSTNDRTRGRSPSGTPAASQSSLIGGIISARNWLRANTFDSSGASGSIRSLAVPHAATIFPNASGCQTRRPVRALYSSNGAAKNSNGNLWSLGIAGNRPLPEHNHSLSAKCPINRNTRSRSKLSRGAGGNHC
jgi:hypothetical protein